MAAGGVVVVTTLACCAGLVGWPQFARPGPVAHDAPHLSEARFDHTYELVGMPAQAWHTRLFAVPDTEGFFFTDDFDHFARIDADGTLHASRLGVGPESPSSARPYLATDGPLVYQDGVIHDFGVSPPTAHPATWTTIRRDHREGFAELWNDASRVAYFRHVHGAQNSSFVAMELDGRWRLVELRGGGSLGHGDWRERWPAKPAMVPLVDAFTGVDGLTDHHDGRRGWRLSGAGDPGVLTATNFARTRGSNGIAYTPFALSYGGEADFELRIDDATLRFWAFTDVGRYGDWQTPLLWFSAPESLGYGRGISFLRVDHHSNRLTDADGRLYLIRPVR